MHTIIVFVDGANEMQALSPITRAEFAEFSIEISESHAISFDALRYC